MTSEEQQALGTGRPLDHSLVLRKLYSFTALVEAKELNIYLSYEIFASKTHL